MKTAEELSTVTAPPASVALPVVRADVQRASTLSGALERSWSGRIVLAISAWFILCFVVESLARIRYPFDLEWIESGMLGQVRWVLAGHKLYVRPSVDFVPFIYHPLFTYVGAVAVKLTGQGYAALRGVSLLCSLTTMAALWSLAHRETNSHGAGLLAAGSYAATFKITEQFMDVARVDAMFVGFGVAALWALRVPTTPYRRVFAGLAMLGCFLTKQSGALMMAPLLAWLFGDALVAGRTVHDRVAAGLGIVVAVGGSLCAVWALDASTDGWYIYYAWQVPVGHRLVDHLWYDFWSSDLMGPLATMCAGALFILVGPEQMPRSVRLLWAAALAGALGTAWSSRLHDGGWPNVMMPAFAVLAALFAVAVARAMELVRRAPDGLGRGLARWIAVVAAAQLAMLIYSPRKVVPKPRDIAAGRALVDRLAAAPGDVLVATHSEMSVTAGKRPHFHQMAVEDLFRAGPSPVAAHLADDIRAAIRTHRFAVIVTDNDFYAPEIGASYFRAGDAVDGDDALFTVTGVHCRPNGVFVPR